MEPFRVRQEIMKIFKLFFLSIMFFIFYSVLFVAIMRIVPPASSAFILDYSTGDMLNFFSTDDYQYGWVSYSDINKNMAIAVVASEDQNFPNHYGFDFKQIEDAIKKNKYRKRQRGASTISQQLAKNMFLSMNKSYVRKGVEVYYTLLMETILGKERILEIYLNVAEFGEGIYGVKKATQIYFKKEPDRLNRNQSALLASVLPRPKKFNYKRPSRYFINRSHRIMVQINQLGGYNYIKDI